MGFLRTKHIYMDMCHRSQALHKLTDEERTMLQQHLKKMYKDIELVCKRHDLRILLAYGSVLGAVRHNGFIPWDDDLDIYMPRKDYDLFINKYYKELPNNYIVYAPNSKNGPIVHFGKIIDKNTLFITPGSENVKHYTGVFVDVFPLENISNNNWSNKIRRTKSLFLKYISGSVRQYERKSKIYKDLMSGSFSAKCNYWFRWIIGCIMSFYKLEKWLNIQDNVFCQVKSETGLLHDPAGWSRDWIPLKEDLFLPPKVIGFDGMEVNVPNKTEEYLKRCYGNWQQIPPPEKRWQHFIVDIKFNITNEIRNE